LEGIVLLSKKSVLLSAVAGAVLLTAGGAQAQSSAPEPAAYHRADGTRTADYNEAVESWRADAQFGIDYSKAYLGLEHAYALGLSGKGVTVGINDSGVYWDHPLFQGRNNGLDTGSSDALGNNGSISTTEPWHSHGTHVAGTAVGRRVEGGLMFGNAFGADIFSSTIHFVGSNYAFGPEYFSGNPIADSMANLMATAEGNHARIINNSWGVSQRSVLHNASLDQINSFYDRYRAQITAQPWDIITKNDTLIVMSAGNDSQFHASLWNMTPHYVPEVRGNFVTVTNYNPNDIQNGSNLCGATATWCVAGPGTNIISSVPDFDFDAEGWSAAHDYMSLLSDAGFMFYFQNYGIATAIDYKHWNEINQFIAARDAAAASGAAFDNEAEMRKLAATLADFSKSLLSLFVDPKAAIGIDAQYLTLNLNDRWGAGLTAADAAFISQAYNDDFLGELNLYMGDVKAGYAAFSGTSMAAPNITGFAALLMEHFPEYNTALITDIMLSSGRDIEEAGVDIRAGWGVPQMGTALAGPSALRDIREVRVGAGTRDIWSNDITDAIDKYSATVLERNPNDIGGLTKIGGGELVLTGNNTYSGATQVNEGLMTVDGSLTRSALTVQNVGIIGGTGTLASLLAQSGGVVAPGNTANPFGTLTVTGDANFKPGSFLWVRANANASEYSKLDVGGVTTLEGGNVIVKADTGTWNLRTRGMQILTSAGGVDGTFDGVSSDLAFLTPTLSYQDNAVLLQLVRNDVSIASAGTSDNERNAGKALDVMTSTNISGNLQLEDAIMDGSFDAVRASLPYLTGEVHASLGGLTASTASTVREAMLDRGRSMPTGSAVEQTVNNRGVQVWASGLFGNGEFDGNDDYRAYRNDSNGYAVGIDKTFDNGAMIGAALGQTRSELDISELASTGKSTTTQFGVYGGTTVRGFGLRAGGTYIDSDLDTTRTVNLNRFSDRLIGEYSGDGWQAWAEASYAFQAGQTALEPYLNYTHYDFSADVVENGGDAALSGELNHSADLVTVGLRTNTLLSADAGRPQLRLTGHLAYTENLDEDGLGFRARFADGPAFDISGPQPLDGGITTGLGINIKATETLSFDVGYSGLHQSDFNENRAYGRVSLRF
jgi:subtilase-type serine protease